jgi:hypothetical protein
MFAKLHRKKFVSDRAPLSDTKFLSRPGVRPELQRFALVAREALARVCHVPATSFYPEDPPASVLKLLSFDWDDLNVSMELEQILGISIQDDTPPFLGQRFFCFYKKQGPQTIGEWCVRVAEFLQTGCGEFRGLVS